jgi:hypothetical protein
MSDQDTGAKGVPLPLKYLCDDAVAQYATNLVVQHTENEFVLSFYQVHSPIILGDEEERQHQLEQIDSVPATCVGRIVISPRRMRKFLSALQQNYEGFVAHFGVADVEDGEQ